MKLLREIFSLRPQIGNVRKVLLSFESAAMLLFALSSGACIVTAQDQKIGLSPQKTGLTLEMTSFIRGSEGSVAVSFPSLKNESNVKIYGVFEYLANETRQTREEHEAAAIKWGGHLASIGSEGEMIFMESLLPGNDPFLIGGERRGNIDDDAGEVGPGPLYWMWLDESLWTYTNWQRDGPSNNRDNSSVVVTKSGNWNDVNSDEMFPAIYKKKINGQLCDNANPCYDGAFCNFSNETNGSCIVCEGNCYDNELNLSIPGAADCQDHCDQSYTVCSDNEKYEYYINPIHRTWEEQEQIASKTFGGHLASIHSDEEMALVESLIDFLSGKFSYVIGGKRRRVHETDEVSGPGALFWMWSDGTSWQYMNWQTVGPSNNTEKSIVVIEEGDNWSDVKDDRIFPAVFKRLITKSSESPTIKTCPSVTSVTPTTMPVTAIPVGPPTGPTPAKRSENDAQSNVGWVIFWIFFTISLILCVGCIYPRYEVVLASLSNFIHSMPCLHWCPRYPSDLGVTSGFYDEVSDDESFGGVGTHLVSDRLIVG
eukprot:CAMPEP_0194288982 /NCGR_PEP_ID=MMETSP0169-20130528/38102_1 /TAXON_ID=218684 /ORGANISM="Corethron pennatum, Strain L29A3" /LENGTH=538 /DNA_ID=CAMNT_0039036145 /DNA_START=90 /DNA_END=1706 /DNA_ORIENTATION=+